MRLTPWAPREDRQRFKSAHTLADLADLADLTALQLQTGRHLDEETLPLLPSLIAANRAGLVTTCSQPALAGTGADGLWWQQRAALEAFTADRDLYQRLVAAAARADMMVAAHDPRTGESDDPVVITLRDGEPYTGLDTELGRAHLRTIWPGARRQALTAAADAVHLVLYAPAYGATGQRLWLLLDELTGLRPPRPWSPWSA